MNNEHCYVRVGMIVFKAGIEICNRNAFGGYLTTFPDIAPMATFPMVPAFTMYPVCSPRTTESGTGVDVDDIARPKPKCVGWNVLG